MSARYRLSRGRVLSVESLESRDVPANFVASGSDPGVPAVARLIDADTNTELFSVTPWAGFTGGVKVAVGDVNGDRTPDLITAAGAGGGPAVRVFDGTTGQPLPGVLGNLFAFEASFRGGLNVATADLNRDGYSDIVIGAGNGGGPVVTAIDGQTGKVLLNFLAYDASFRGGVNVAAGDVDGDDRADIIAGAGVGGGPHVKVFRPTGELITQFLAYDASFRGGVNVAAADTDGNTTAEVITGAGAGGAPHVKIFNGLTGAALGGFFADDVSKRDGVQVGTRFAANDPTAVICTLTPTGQRDFDGETFKAVAAATGGAYLGSCVAGANTVTNWADITVQTLWRTNTAPTRAARVLGIVGAAMFDAVNSITGGFQAYRTKVAAPAGASADAAAAVAAHRTLSWLYPTRQAIFDACLAASLDAITNETAKANGIVVGAAVADAMIAWRKTDGSGNVVPYTPGTDPGDYQLTPPNFRPVLDPHWGSVTPFVLTAGNQFRPGPPPDLTSAEYAAAFNEVKAIGQTTSTTRTAEQALIGHFWADLPNGGSVAPPGHFFEIGTRLAREKNLSLIDSARMFGLIGLAVADAGIVSWDAKNFYDYWRPETAIRAADTDGNPDTAADPNWVPLWASPNFQSYTSGHSTFSSAAAAVLAGLFGDNTKVVTSSDDVPGAVRTFSSFSAAAAEAGKSRVYGGIHFEFDNQAGLASGRATGQYVVANAMKPV